ncbi:hypothetical protein D9M71_682420 [compost metagenome]
MSAHKPSSGCVFSIQANTRLYGGHGERQVFGREDPIASLQDDRAHNILVLFEWFNDCIESATGTVRDRTPDRIRKRPIFWPPGSFVEGRAADLYAETVLKRRECDEAGRSCGTLPGSIGYNSTK